MKRLFRYGDIPLEDPDPNSTPEQVKAAYSTLYFDLINAKIDGPKIVDGVEEYTFRRVAGTKGTAEDADMSRFIVHPLTSLQVAEIIVENALPQSDDETVLHPPVEFLGIV